VPLKTLELGSQDVVETEVAPAMTDIAIHTNTLDLTQPSRTRFLNKMKMESGMKSHALRTTRILRKVANNPSPPLNSVKKNNSIKVTSKEFPRWANGWWQDRDDEVASRFHFAFDLEKLILTVRVFDSHDGEELVVKKLSICNHWVEFSTFVPSTKFSARHRWLFQRQRTAVHELILSEKWVKASSDRFDRLLVKKRSQNAENRKPKATHKAPSKAKG
jgi:hypothetical protein